MDQQIYVDVEAARRRYYAHLEDHFALRSHGEEHLGRASYVGLLQAAATATSLEEGAAAGTSGSQSDGAKGTTSIVNQAGSSARQNILDVAMHETMQQGESSVNMIPVMQWPAFGGGELELVRRSMVTERNAINMSEEIRAELRRRSHRSIDWSLFRNCAAARSLQMLNIDISLFEIFNCSRRSLTLYMRDQRFGSMQRQTVLNLWQAEAARLRQDEMEFMQHHRGAKPVRYMVCPVCHTHSEAKGREYNSFTGPQINRFSTTEEEGQ